MVLKKIPFFLKFKHPFKLSSVERLGTDNLYLKLDNQGFIGWGEAVFPPYLQETINSASDALIEVDWVVNKDETIFDLIARNQTVLKHFPAAACAMEVCLLNWYAKFHSMELHEVLDLIKVDTPTSYTIGICSDIEIKQRVEENPEAKYFKLKVNEQEFNRIIKAYQAVSKKPFVVDANQGFTSKHEALKCANKLHDLGAAYFEQPFLKQNFKDHAWLKSKTKIPIIADESFQRIGDMDKLLDSFDGINVKIMKTGGLIEAKEALIKAKKYGLITVLGCMSGSSVAIKAAQSISSLTNYVDLDGMFLISNDPFTSKEAENW